MSKVIFLDIDGVLNSEKTIEEEYHRRGLQFTNETLQKFMAPRLVSKLNDIIMKTGAQVVLSSSWRVMHPYDNIIAILKEAGFVGVVIDRTPWMPGDDRGAEIEDWLKTNGQEVISYVILDDEDDMLHLKDRLVQTTFDKGLEDQHVEAAITMLNA